MFTRNRQCPGTRYEMSHDPRFCKESVACWLPAISSYAIRRVSSGVNGAIPEILTGVNSPESSTAGKLPGDRIRSLTLPETPSMASNNAGVGTGLDAGSTGVGALLAAVSTSVILPYL